MPDRVSAVFWDSQNSLAWTNKKIVPYAERKKKRYNKRNRVGMEKTASIKRRNKIFKDATSV